jgi:hypothetical protein
LLGLVRPQSYSQSVILIALPCKSVCTNALQCYVKRVLQFLVTFLHVNVSVHLSNIINRQLSFLSPRSPVYVNLCLNVPFQLFVQCRIMLRSQILATQLRYGTLFSCSLTHTHTHTNTTFLSDVNQLTTPISVLDLTNPFPLSFQSPVPQIMYPDVRNSPDRHSKPGGNPGTTFPVLKFSTINTLG